MQLQYFFILPDMFWKPIKTITLIMQSRLYITNRVQIQQYQQTFAALAASTN